jgi:hypothetical protein
MGSSQAQADQQALASLISYFSQKVQAELNLVERESQTTANGRTQSSNSLQVENSVQTAASMDKLIGAEIKERSDDGRTYYALAALEKQSAVLSYSDLLASNQRQIDQLLDISPDDKDSFIGYSRYLKAAKIADENAVYGSVLSLLDGQSRQLVTGTKYRIEADAIIENIPVTVKVDNDKSDRINGAFARVLQEQGFHSGGTNARYVLNVTVEMAEAPATSQNIFARYKIISRLIDTSTNNNELVTFNIEGREGHNNSSEAEERAIRAAVKNISENYSAKLTDYFSKLQ